VTAPGLLGRSLLAGDMPLYSWPAVVALRVPAVHATATRMSVDAPIWSNPATVTMSKTTE